MKKYLFVLVLLGLQTVAQAAALGDVVQQKLDAIKSMRAHFNQTVKAGKRLVSTSSGTMALSKPGKFRWQTDEPLEQILIADSKHLWIYDKDLDQVTVKKQQKNLGGTPGLFLNGEIRTVTRDFAVTQITDPKALVYELRALSPKESYQRLRLTFQGDQLTRIDFFDQMGQHTRVDLSAIKQNTALPAKLFQFKPPKGVDLIRQ